MTGNGQEHVWFEDVHVFLNGLELLCAVEGKTVALPVVILHPACTLSEAGDVGRLGVPRHWAEGRGLLAG